MTPRILRRLTVAGVALILLTPMTTAVAQAKPAVPKIAWGSCGTDPKLKPFQCATVEATRPYADLYPDARMVTVEGWGHTTIGKSTCADRLITDYLTQLKAPADGSTCTQDREPFDPVPTGKKALSLLPQ